MRQKGQNRVCEAFKLHFFAHKFKILHDFSRKNGTIWKMNMQSHRCIIWTARNGMNADFFVRIIEEIIDTEGSANFFYFWNAKTESGVLQWGLPQIPRPHSHFFSHNNQDLLKLAGRKYIIGMADWTSLLIFVSAQIIMLSQCPMLFA